MILVTGAAGFIGFHVTQELLNRGKEIVAIDSVNSYYEPTLKENRLKILNDNNNFNFHRFDLCDFDKLKAVFDKYKPKIVCHLAAQAGVRYSLSHPFAYQKSNNEAFLNIIELSKNSNVENFVYASSSSVYGSNTNLPFSENDRVDNPISLYAATKRSNELVAHCYSHLFNLNCSGLRFFTVYGPWGRPDMALFIFTKAIINNQPIDVYNNGKMKRNFTYIDDIVDGILRVLETPKEYELYNIGNNRAEDLLHFISVLEQKLGKKATYNFLPMQPGDVRATVADIEKIRALGFEPKTNIEQGIENFVKWYREYYS
ncbi:NAD-dependent epimerase/dehydratase family protein [Chitinispirillales bacterium ANBcel5]|uniref:NAD-dependent epimerase/dehydratase family protein n=1 Tax=Cellulosispirillum alkaliphilum TaxID=3039283 RepID=UPI002A53515D|nr:NAD-dependent epimerase/dehydratase family protein [Chitinispirillales bacterium ANBcel5]